MRRRLKEPQDKFDYGIDAHVTAEYYDLFGRHCSSGYLEEMIKSSNLGEQFYAAARLLAVFSKQREATSDLITHIAERKADLTPAMTRIFEFMTSGNDRGLIFNAPHILLNVMKYLLVYGEVDTWNRQLRSAHDPNVLVHTLYLYTMVSSYVPWTNTYDQHGILLGSVQNSVFLIQTDTMSTLQRAKECLIHINRRQESFKSKEYVDVEALFERVMGFSLEDYLLFLTCFIVLFNPEGKTVDKLLWTMEWRYDLNYFTDALMLSRDVCQRILDELSLSITDFRNQHETSLKRAYDMAYFRFKPIARIEDTFFPVYYPFLTAAVWEGVYWNISDRLSEDEGLKFRSFFGRIFETYCQDLLESIQTEISGQFYREFTYGHDKKQTPDAFIKYGSHLVVFEFKTKRLNMEKTMINGEWDTFEKDLELMLFSPARQMKKRLLQMQQAKGLPFDMKEIKWIHPIIVTQGSFSGMKQLYQHLDEQLRERGLYDDLPIMKWHLMDVNEFEGLVGLLHDGVNLSNLLARKAHKESFRHLPFNNFFHETHPTQRQAPTIKTRVDAIFNDLVRRLEHEIKP